jgi:hypothetical protein
MAILVAKGLWMGTYSGSEYGAMKLFPAHQNESRKAKENKKASENG